MTDSLRRLLAHHIRTHGPLPCARVSSAASHTQYSYWGVAQYSIRLRVARSRAERDHDRLTCVCTSAAPSSRRSLRLAHEDCDAVCAARGWLHVVSVGRPTDVEVMRALRHVGLGAAVARHLARRVETLRPLTLEERFLVHHLRRVGYTDTPAREVRAGHVRREGRWIMVGGYHAVYVPYRDARDSAAFAAEANQERRRLIVRACGERVVGAPTVIQRDDYGTLVETWDSRRQVRVVCPSTGAVYWLPVPRSCRTAHEAVAATFGLDAASYAPLAEA